MCMYGSVPVLHASGIDEMRLKQFLKEKVSCMCKDRGAHRTSSGYFILPWPHGGFLLSTD